MAKLVLANFLFILLLGISHGYLRRFIRDDIYKTTMEYMDYFHNQPYLLFHHHILTSGSDLPATNECKYFKKIFTIKVLLKNLDFVIAAAVAAI